MSIDYLSLKNRAFEDILTRYEARDAILYALALGLGQDPCDNSQLAFVYEEKLSLLPTMAVVLAHPGFWLQRQDTGVDWRKVLHGEQWLTLHKVLPSSGTVIGRSRVLEIVDKGQGKGAFVYSKRELIDCETGDLLATAVQTAVCRGDGGFGGPGSWSDAPKLRPVPESQPEIIVNLETRPESALLYRLCGDFNPLHADPAVARAVGFDRPILHGLATYGMAGHALLKALCAYDAGRLRRFDCRFVAPVYPGETIVTEIWMISPTEAAFRCRVREREVVVLDFGFAQIGSAASKR